MMRKIDALTDANEKINAQYEVKKITCLNFNNKSIILVNAS